MDKEVKGFRDWVQEHRLQWGVVLVFVLWLSRVLSVLFFPQWFKPFDIYETPSFTLLLLVWFVLLSVGLVGGGIVCLTRTSWGELGWRRKGLVKAIGLGVLGYILTLVSLTPIIMVRGVGAGQYSNVSLSVARFLLVTFFAFGIPAWVEENLFRGYMQPLLAQRVKLWMAIVIQAAIFSAAHLGYASGLAQFVWLFVSGLIYGWLRGRNGSLIAPYLAHGLGWMVLVFGPAAF
jgi:membrane protease YdiL (CAAX protease family)